MKIIKAVFMNTLHQKYPGTLYNGQKKKFVTQVVTSDREFNLEVGVANKVS